MMIFFGEKKYESDKLRWKALSFEDLESVRKCRNIHHLHTNCCDWKELYKQQHLGNNPKLKPIPKSSSSMRFLNLNFMKKIYTIPMFGDNAYSSAENVLYKMMYEIPVNSVMKMTGLHPGKEGIGGGVGFKIEENELNLTVMYKFQDHGILAAMRPQWKSLLKAASGYIFVVDGVYDLENFASARSQLHGLVNDEYASIQAALLIFACNVTDTTKQLVTSPLPEIVEHLGLKALQNRKWYMRCLDINTLEGLLEGLSWLSNAVSDN